MTDEEPAAGVATRHLVITVHGIRTFGHWQERLEVLLQAAALARGSQVTVVNYKYGYFSAIAFLSVFLRSLTVWRFKKQLLMLNALGWDRIDIVAHSFGTHLVARALYSLRKTGCPPISTLILAGSVLPSRFNWSALVPRHVGRVVNECGIRDRVLLLSQSVPMLGMAGLTGFFGMTGATLRNRFFDIGHGGYFRDGRRDTDAFMRDRWLPLLLSTDAIQPFDVRPAGRFVGLEAFLLNNARPLKVAGYAGLLALLYGYGVPWAGRTYAVNLVSQEHGYVSQEDDGLKVWFDEEASPARSLHWLSSIGPIQHLDMAATTVTDSDFEALGRIESLEILKLGQTRLTHRSLQTLSRFPALRELALYNLRLGTLDGLPTLPNLHTLDLDGNGLVDADLAHLPRLSGLRVLLLAGNRITGSGLTHLTNLKQLRRLDIHANRLHDEGFLRLPSLPELRELDISENADLRGATLHALAGLSALEELWAKDTGIDTAFLTQFPHLSHLRVLALPGSNLRGSGLRFLKRLPRLQELYAGGADLVDSDLAGLLNTPELQKLYVPTNPGVTDASLPLLATLRKLRELNVDFTGVTPSGRAEIKRARRTVKLVSLN